MIRESLSRRTNRAGILVLAALLACEGADPGSSVTGMPAEDPGPQLPERADELLPEGTYALTLTTCGQCAPESVPDYLLVFADGVRGTVEIDGATEWSATLRLIEMRASEHELGDILGLFAQSVSVVFRDWNAADIVFRGAIPYGPAAEFVPIFRRANGLLQCEFALVHRKHDVGMTTCTASRLGD